MNRQYAFEGFIASFFFCVGAIGFVCVLQSLERNDAIRKIMNRNTYGNSLDDSNRGDSENSSASKKQRNVRNKKGKGNFFSSSALLMMYVLLQ